MINIRWNSIGFQIFIWFLLCSFILLVLYSVVYYKRTTDQNNIRVSEIALKNVRQASEYLDILGNSYDSLSKSVTGNFDIKRLVSNESPEPAEQLINEQAISSILGSIYYSRKDIIGMYVLTENGKIFSYGTAFQAIDLNYSKSDWYQRLTKSSKGQMIWFGLQNQSLIDQIWNTPVFAFGRQIYDSYLRKSVGVVLIEVVPTGIVNTLNNLRIGSSGKSFILSSENEVLAGDDLQLQHFLNSNETDILSLNDNELYSVINQPDSLFIKAKQKDLNWKVLSIAQKADLNLEVNETRRFLLLVLAVLILVSIVLASFISRSFSSPMKKIIHEMKRVEQGNFNGNLEIKSFDEVNFLVSAFNRMVSRVNQLIERVRIISVSEKNAQLQALQSQINPHFLYNTLDMIYWMLDEKENDQLGNIIFSLSKMFRYSSDWENSLNVTVQEEIEQIKHYLLILQFRMEGKLDFQMDISDEWLQLNLPKMTLQPIIENAVVHGFSMNDSRSYIRIYTESDGQTLRLHIQDNGKGIPKERLIFIQEKLKRTTNSDSGMSASTSLESESMPDTILEATNIGLMNVHSRLVMKFGPAYGLEINSTKQQGTDVVILLPINIKGNNASFQKQGEFDE